ncbi:uncharacterized protein LOC141910857 [Tubulanus polymorphus]|uniref:uncharacterized protein LOC141910857 n=1 Tax=Tubulanus polymorphus TaxID=672921 RepID=UPI003DA21FF2
MTTLGLGRSLKNDDNKTPAPPIGMYRSHTCASIPSKRMTRKKDGDGGRELGSSMTISRMNTALSMSDMDLRKSQSRQSQSAGHTSGTSSERSKIYLHGAMSTAAQGRMMPKPALNVAKATLPKSGMVKLTALSQERHNPSLFDNKDEVKRQKVKPAPMSHKKLHQKQKDLLGFGHIASDQIRYAREPDWLDRDLPGTTFRDLQKTILQFSDFKPQKEQPTFFNFSGQKVDPILAPQTGTPSPQSKMLESPYRQSPTTTTTPPFGRNDDDDIVEGHSSVPPQSPNISQPVSSTDLIGGDLAKLPSELLTGRLHDLT